MGLHCRFLGVGFSLDDDPPVLTPGGSLSLGFGPKDTWINPFEIVVILEFLLDLFEEFRSCRLVMRKDRNGDFRVLEDLLNDTREGDYGRLVMFPGPQIDMIIGGLFDFSTSLI